MNIIWNTPYPVGGVTAFCVHLHKVTSWPILRLSRVTQRPRALAQWGVQYQNIRLDDLPNDPLVLGGGSWTIDESFWPWLYKNRQVWTVLHDETEFKSMPHTRHLNPRRVIVMREPNLSHYPTAALLPQPYAQRYSGGDFVGTDEQKLRHIHAVSTARLDGMKGTEQILLANRLLSKSKRIQLWGAPNRLWVFGKKAKYPELSALKGFPPTFGAGADLHRQAQLGVDMTTIGLDGGVQYTLLEALDGGSMPITTSLFRVKGIAQWVANSPSELTDLVRDKLHVPGAAEHNRAWLDEHHAPATVRRAWAQVVR